MKITVTRLNSDVHFEARNEDGNTLQMDGSPEVGGQQAGMRPTQLLLAALGGCSGIDIVSILKKQRQDIRSFRIDVDGDREKVEEYQLFRKIHVHFILEGDIDPIKAQKAAQLSIDKYCSVAKTLEPTATITYSVTIQ